VAQSNSAAHSPPAACSRARPALGLPPARAADERVPLVSETEAGEERRWSELAGGGDSGEANGTNTVSTQNRTG
jgi:hypothetical protein